jgi:sugar/nucleoside kinase (ribokinase family)
MLLFDTSTEKNDKNYVIELLGGLQKLGPKVVIITDGKRGSYALSEDGESYWHGLNEGKVVERTGAGDAYTAGFLAAIFNHLSVPKAMEWGGYNATSVVGQIGAETGLLTKEKMEEEVEGEVKTHEDSGSEKFNVLPAPVED